MLTIVPLALLTLAPELTTVTTLTADEAELTLADIFLSSEVAATFGIFREDDDGELRWGFRTFSKKPGLAALMDRTIRGGTAVGIMPPPPPSWVSTSGTMSGLAISQVRSPGVRLAHPPPRLTYCPDFWKVGRFPCGARESIASAA